MKSLLLGVLFDLDGTLVDSTRLHLRSFLAALDDLGIPHDQQTERMFYSMVGERFMDIVRAIYPDLDEQTLLKIRELKWAHMHEYLEELRVLPHVFDVLDQLTPYPKALVTSASRQFVQWVFDKTGLGRYFSVVVAAEDVVRGKPAPDPYREGARRLGVSHAVVVGDTVFDFRSAVGAGFPFFPAQSLPVLPQYLRGVGRAFGLKGF